MGRIKFWARSRSGAETNSESHAPKQPLSQHLQGVANLAIELARLARPGDHQFSRDAELAGLMHDLGKYSEAFQKMLETGAGECQHAIHGAILTAGKEKPLYPHIALAIAGHHTGIPDHSGNELSLVQKLQNRRLQTEAEVQLGPAAADCERLRQALDKIAEFSRPSHNIPASERDLYIRMLFSCLVDADRLDAAGKSPDQVALSAAVRLKKLFDHLNALSAASPDSAVKHMRKKVLEDCLRSAKRSGNLFSLSAPTGGGKTLAAIAFALQRAASSSGKFRRIIVVLPSLSMIEQKARIYASVFGADAVMEQHSGDYLVSWERADEDSGEGLNCPADENEESLERTGNHTDAENWDAPLIVTTSTRYFESLFSNRPKNLRRTHNIARSIVILDEVQTIPRRLLSPLLSMQKELAERWGVDFVFANTTQSAFERRGERNGCLWEPGTIQEIIEDPESLRTASLRTLIDWRLSAPMSWQQVAKHALSNQQSLIVVNLRAHACELYSTVVRLAGELGGSLDGLFHLSGRMCAAHRLRVLDSIRKRIEAGRSCHVISTQLIEGIDIDFPLVMRAIGPLESVIQAAGRADREGKLTTNLGRPGGQTIVFLPEDNKLPPHEYEEATCVTLALAREQDIQPDSLDAIHAYFKRYYKPGDPTALGQDLSGLRDNLKFAELGRRFEYLNSHKKDVLVPDDDDARITLEVLRGIGRFTPELRGKLYRHTVGLNSTEFRNAAGVLSQLRPDSDVWIVKEGKYDKQLGVTFDSAVEQSAA